MICSIKNKFEIHYRGQQNITTRLLWIILQVLQCNSCLYFNFNAQLGTILNQFVFSLVIYKVIFNIQVLKLKF